MALMEDDASAPLSAREIECVRLTAEGHSSPRIAGRLGLSVITVNAHISSAKTKIGAQSRSALVAKAFRLGLIR